MTRSQLAGVGGSTYAKQVELRAPLDAFALYQRVHAAVTACHRITGKNLPLLVSLFTSSKDSAVSLASG